MALKDEIILTMKNFISKKFTFLPKIFLKLYMSKHWSISYIYLTPSVPDMYSMNAEKHTLFIYISGTYWVFLYIVHVSDIYNICMIYVLYIKIPNMYLIYI
jgi:hypothetical protein